MTTPLDASSFALAARSEILAATISGEAGAAVDPFAVPLVDRDAGEPLTAPLIAGLVSFVGVETRELSSLSSTIVSSLSSSNETFLRCTAGMNSTSNSTCTLSVFAQKRSSDVRCP